MKPAVIHRALVAAYHHAPLSRGQLLTSSYSKNDALPSLVWKIGSWKEQDWTPEEQRIVWTIPATLTVRSEQDDPTRLLEVVQDISDWTESIQGLPIDDDNNIVPLFDEQKERFLRGEIRPIAERFSGPHVDSVTCGEINGDVYTASYLFSMEFTVEHPQPAGAVIRQFVLGIQPMDPEYKSIGYDPNKPFKLQLPLAEDPDVFSRTPYAAPDLPLRTAAGDRIYGAFPPLLRDYPGVAGPDPATTLVRLDVIPAAFALSAGSPTKKCDAIGYFVDGGTTRLDTQATWQTSAPAVATVGSDGTVTQVGAGSATITATYNGVSNTASVTVS